MQWLRVEEEIQAMDEELAKAGVQMPTFGSIGGVLAKEVRINTYIYIHGVYQIHPCTRFSYTCSSFSMMTAAWPGLK